MTLERAQAAIARLVERGSVDKLLYLNVVRRNPILATDPRYQRIFKGYYRMGRRSAAFYEAFFAMLYEGAAGNPPSLKEALLKLHAKIGERHLSFCSKLLATLHDRAVIFDRNVATYFDVPFGPLPNNCWLDEALQRHRQVSRGIAAFIREPEWPKICALFNKSFPETKHLPDVRKADLVIWAAYDD